LVICKWLNNYDDFIIALNYVDDEYIPLFKDKGYVSQSNFEKMPKKYIDAIDQRLNAIITQK